MGTQLMGGAAPPQSPPSAPPGTPAPSGGGGGGRGRKILAIVLILIAVGLAAVLITLALVTPTVRSTTSDGAKDKGAEATQTGDPSGSGTIGGGDPDGERFDVSSGPITSPGSGDADRSALMDAAREAIGTEAQFYVLQIYVQGTAALAELQPVDSTDVRAFAFRNDGGWKAVWVGVVDGQNTLDAINTADIGLSDELVDAMDWTPAPSEDEAGRTMVDMLISGSGLDPTAFTADVLSLVKGTDGGWWAWGWVYTSDSTLESEQFFICRPKGSTQWNAVKVGTGLDVTDLENDAPPNVIEQFNACDS